VIGGGAFAALAGIAALIAARRRRTVKFEDSIIGGTDIKTNTVIRLDRRRSSTPARIRSRPTSAAKVSAASTPTKSIRSPRPRCISRTGAMRRPRRS
jgi:hypothetical protein